MSEEPGGDGITALILCNGEPPSAALLEEHLREADLVICTDGAFTWATKARVPVDLVLGDMDSLSEDAVDVEVLAAGPHEVQENSDAEKAIAYALERGASRITLLGATGRRLDHTLANVWLAYSFRDRAEIVIADDFGDLCVVTGRRSLRLPVGATVSLMPLTTDAAVATAGLQWPLSGPLEPGSRGLSNRVVCTEAVVDVQSGAVALITLRERG
jgi:thiamine pyrophosphokinase